MNVRTIKFCPGCREMLAAKEFGKDRARSDGLTSWCKACRRKPRAVLVWEGDVAGREKLFDRYEQQGRQIWVQTKDGRVWRWRHPTPEFETWDAWLEGMVRAGRKVSYQAREKP